MKLECKICLITFPCLASVWINCQVACLVCWEIYKSQVSGKASTKASPHCSAFHVSVPKRGWQKLAKIGKNWQKLAKILQILPGKDFSRSQVLRLSNGVWGGVRYRMLQSGIWRLDLKSADL